MNQSGGADGGGEIVWHFVMLEVLIEGRILVSLMKLVVGDTVSTGSKTLSD